MYKDIDNGYIFLPIYPDSKVHGANMGPTWVLSAPDGPHIGPMNLAIRVHYSCVSILIMAAYFCPSPLFLCVQVTQYLPIPSVDEGSPSDARLIWLQTTSNTVRMKTYPNNHATGAIMHLISLASLRLGLQSDWMHYKKGSKVFHY